MLPAVNRLTDSETFRLTVRSGRRAGSRRLVVHLFLDAQGAASAPQVGFTVSKAVGNAVERNRVKRRLRHLMVEHLPHLVLLPGRVVVVVRALPPAASASGDQLGEDLRRALERTIGTRVSA